MLSFCGSDDQLKKLSEYANAIGVTKGNSIEIETGLDFIKINKGFVRLSLSEAKTIRLLRSGRPYSRDEIEKEIGLSKTYSAQLVKSIREKCSAAIQCELDDVIFTNGGYQLQPWVKILDDPDKFSGIESRKAKRFEVICHNTPIDRKRVRELNKVSDKTITLDLKELVSMGILSNNNGVYSLNGDFKK